MPDVQYQERVDAFAATAHLPPDLADPAEFVTAATGRSTRTVLPVLR